MKTFTNLPTSASQAKTARRRNRRVGRPGRLHWFPFHSRKAARKLSTTLRLYTASLDAVDGTKYGLAVCPICDELVAVFVRSRGQLVCLTCAEWAA